MSQDEWFDEDADEFEISSKKKGRKPKKRHSPEDEDWIESNDWDDFEDTL